MQIFGSSSHEEAVYELMLERIDCGPFDGGCLVFAQALQQLHGGEVVVVEGRCFSGWAGVRVPEYRGALLAQHAVLRLPNGMYLDASGLAETKQSLLASSALTTKYAASAEEVRPLREGDLEDAPRDDLLVAELAQLLTGSPSHLSCNTHCADVALMLR